MIRNLILIAVAQGLTAGAMIAGAAGPTEPPVQPAALADYIASIVEEPRPEAFQIAQAEAGEQVIVFDFQTKPTDEEDIFEQPVFNEFVTLDFKNADIQNVIRLISARTGLNILLNPDEVRGIITLHLDNVRLGHALDSILKVNRLAYIVEQGNIVRIVPESKVGRNEIETHTEVIALNWRNAADVEETFRQFLTPHGSLKSNEEAQAIIITDVPPNIMKIKELIAQIDKPDRQVVIEARLVDIQLDAARTFATQWGLSKSSDIVGFDQISGFGHAFDDVLLTEAFGDLVDGSVGTVGGVFPVLIEGLGLTGGKGTVQFGSTVTIFGDKYDVNAGLTALETRGVVEVLANPRVTTLNNVPADIQIVTRIPYIEAVSGGSSQFIIGEVEFEEAGVKITVKPIITPNGFVRLEMDLEQKIFRGRVSAGGADAFNPPLIDLRRSHSTVIVRDRNTVVLGGLRSKEKRETIKGVPWLHRVPVIGWMFKDKQNDEVKTELVLMVTPTIVEEAELTDRDKQLYDRLDADWHLPDYFYDELKSEGDLPHEDY